jgi:hypothetical protein
MQLLCTQLMQEMARDIQSRMRWYIFHCAVFTITFSVNIYVQVLTFHNLSLKSYHFTTL